ncbi:MAG: hypothetical protein IMZ71_05475 [Chloroflexi bacterium]|nr:hypothetical protein [Chloroflexota bacterium]
MGRDSDSYIGLQGAGAEIEFDIKHETERAYLLVSDDGKEFWMPKSAFDDDGMLLSRFKAMLEEKLETEKEGE